MADIECEFDADLWPLHRWLEIYAKRETARETAKRPVLPPMQIVITTSNEKARRQFEFYSKVVSQHDRERYEWPRDWRSPKLGE